jgi:nucleoside 2-deoxyribosyltransferase
MIYLISKISKHAHRHNECIAAIASDYFKQGVFIPHEHNPFDIDHDKLEFQVFNEDLNQMKRAEIAVACLPIGNDCSGEIGWFAGANKYVCTFIIDTGHIPINDQITQLQKDWMTKGFLSEVFVQDKKIYDLLKEDKIIGNKITMLGK